MDQYVYLKALFPDAELEKLVIVTFQSGYIYIQTDKTLYTPNSRGASNVKASKEHSNYIVKMPLPVVKSNFKRE